MDNSVIISTHYKHSGSAKQCMVEWLEGRMHQNDEREASVLGLLSIEPVPL